MATFGCPQICYQQADVAAFGQRANSVIRGSQHMDMSVTQFLLEARTELGDHTYQRLMGYAAELQMLGILAGVIDGPTEEYRAAIREAVGTYFTQLLQRSERTSWWENLSPLDAAATGLGYWYRLFGAGADVVGATETARQWNETGDALLRTDPEKFIANVTMDFLGSLWDDCKKRWDQFWKDFEEKGLLVAYGKLQIDAQFLAAEIGIGIALSVVTGGAAGAAMAGIRIVGQRISAAATRVIVRVVNRASRGAVEAGKVLDRAIPDEQINRRIVREVFDEDKLGLGSPRDDVARRAEVPNQPVNRPQGGSSGGNPDPTPPFRHPRAGMPPRSLEELAPGGRIPGTSRDPSVFQNWWDDLSPAELQAVMNDDALARTVNRRIRGDGSMHEWLKVSQQLEHKRLGFSMREIQEWVTATREAQGPLPRPTAAGDVRWRHSPESGTGSGTGSGTMHNALDALYQPPPRSRDELLRRMGYFANHYLDGGIDGLPPGLRRAILSTGP